MSSPGKKREAKDVAGESGRSPTMRTSYAMLLRAGGERWGEKDVQWSGNLHVMGVVHDRRFSEVTQKTRHLESPSNE